MPLKNLTFNGVRKPWLYLLAGRQKAPFAPMRRNLLTVPGKPGAYLQSSEVEPVVIHQPIGFDATDDVHALQLKDELATWLITDEPVPLQFDDEPGRTYYAVVQNTLEDFTRFMNFRQGTIQFLCLDPYSYGPELTATFPSDVVTLTNNGTAPADPIFELEVLQPVTFALIQNQEDEYMMIGKPIDIDSIVVDEYELIKHDTMSTTTGWTTGDQVDGGIVTGEMVSQGNRFVASSFGTAQSGWHGPALKTSLSETLQDFRVEALIENMNASGVGRVEIYLLDVNNNAIAKMAMKDTSLSTPRNFGEIRAGGLSDGKYIIAESPITSSGRLMWNDFDGIVRVERVGNEWLAHIGKITDGRHHSRRTVRFTDIEEKYMQQVAQIQVHIATSGGHTPTQMSIKDIKVWKVNKLEDNEIPYIAHPGDVITFDHKSEELLINGEDRTELKDFGATYFKLKQGFNQLVVYPSDSFNVSVRYRERYL
ncbi:distal tail protein Dit [Caldalkalibacillus uzonensis]|nr:distal tail protein Dit [Caldalkalibacillus uzonensis]